MKSLFIDLLCFFGFIGYFLLLLNEISDKKELLSLSYAKKKNIKQNFLLFIFS